MRIGTVVSQRYFNSTAPQDQVTKFMELLCQNFCEIGPLAFGQIRFLAHETPENYNWQTLDNLVATAESNNVELHYNTVINNKNSFPQWYWQLSPLDKIKALEKHVRAVVSRYKGKFYLYKLVNEVVRDEETDFLGTGTSRSDLLARIFRWAREEDPSALLMINDFGTLVREDIREAYIKMVLAVLEKGGPIDVVGEQGHLGHPSPFKTPVFQLPEDKMVNEALNRIHEAIHLPIYLTEFDLSFNNSPLQPYEGSAIDPCKPFTDISDRHYDTWFHYQAFAYKHFYELCLGKEFVHGLIFWGFYDGDALKNERPGTGFFDRDFNPKIVYEEMQDVFAKHRYDDQLFTSSINSP